MTAKAPQEMPKGAKRPDLAQSAPPPKPGSGCSSKRFKQRPPRGEEQCRCSCCKNCGWIGVDGNGRFYRIYDGTDMVLDDDGCMVPRHVYMRKQADKYASMQRPSPPPTTENRGSQRHYPVDMVILAMFLMALFFVAGWVAAFAHMGLVR